jgi:hypothetical protein
MDNNDKPTLVYCAASEITRSRCVESCFTRSPGVKYDSGVSIAITRLIVAITLQYFAASEITRSPGVESDFTRSPGVKYD